MSRIKSVAIFLIVLLVGIAALSACSSPREGLLNKLTSEEGQLIQEKSDEIIRCLTDKDKEAFCELFSEQARQSDTFDQEVDAVFDFFSCEVYIKSEVVDTAGGESSSKDGERTEWSVSPEITYIEVLQEGNGDGEELLDRYYGVKYDWQIKDSANPEHEGLNHFEITLLNIDEKVEVGKNE